MIRIRQVAPEKGLFVIGVLAALASIFGSAGCDRRPRFVSRDADSTAALALDSLSVYVQLARAGWEGGDPSAAAGLTARLVVEDLRAHAQASIAARMRTFIDSLGFGVEIAGGKRIAAASFFARSDPSAGSWPYLFWRESSGPRHQWLEASGMRLVDVAIDDPGVTGGNEVTRRVAILFARTTGAGQQPLVFVWSRAPSQSDWSLVQSLGPDSLGGTGTASFDRSADARGVLVTRTWENAAGFTECGTCPHIFRVRRYAWDESGLHAVSEETEPSAYASFVDFVHALQVGDRELAESLVDDRSLIEAAQAYEWHRSKGQWRVAPGTDARAQEMVLFRGNVEAYRVRFTSRRGTWRIDGFDPTSRSIE